MKYILLIVIILLSSLICTAQSFDLIPYRISTKWGYSDKSGQIIITPQYDSVRFFSCGIAVVGNVNKCDNYITTDNLKSGVYHIRWKSKDQTTWTDSRFVKIR